MWFENESANCSLEAVLIIAANSDCVPNTKTPTLQNLGWMKRGEVITIEMTSNFKLPHDLI